MVGTEVHELIHCRKKDTVLQGRPVMTQDPCHKEMHKQDESTALELT